MEQVCWFWDLGSHGYVLIPFNVCAKLLQEGSVCCAGLDVDKLDYLLRDQLMCFGVHSPGRFNTFCQLEALFRHARIVAVPDPDSAGGSEVVTDIAFENTLDQELVKLVDDIFQTRSVMHEKVYQCGCVVQKSPLSSLSPLAWDSSLLSVSSACK